MTTASSTCTLFRQFGLCFFSTRGLRLNLCCIGSGIVGLLAGGALGWLFLLSSLSLSTIGALASGGLAGGFFLDVDLDELLLEFVELVLQLVVL